MPLQYRTGPASQSCAVTVPSILSADAPSSIPNGARLAELCRHGPADCPTLCPSNTERGPPRRIAKKRCVWHSNRCEIKVMGATDPINLAPAAGPTFLFSLPSQGPFPSWRRPLQPCPLHPGADAVAAGQQTGVRYRMTFPRMIAGWPPLLALPCPLVIREGPQPPCYQGGAPAPLWMAP